MELLLRRNQKGGMMGGVKFILEASVRLTDAESGYVKKYKMSDVVLYEKGSDKVAQATGTMTFLAARFMQLKVTVDDLVRGKTIDGKDIIDIMAAQDQIKEAVAIFKTMLHAAATFEGEEVLSF